MANQKTNEDVLKHAVRCYLEAGRSEREGARLANVARSTFRGRLINARERGLLPEEKKEETGTYELVIPPEEDIPTDQLVEQLHERYKRRKKRVDATKWHTIRMKSDEPIALLWMGDPHIDDNYCDWDAIKRDIAIIKSDPNIYGCGLGDYQNNWVGRLARLYAEQDTSHNTAWKLVEWLIQSIDPLILIGGNHDMWSGSGDPLRWMMKPHTIHEDWVAQIQIKFPNGSSCKIHAAHDHPGHSQWNPLHGQQKAAMFKSNAHLYIAGHKHNWALANLELVDQHMCTWLARAKGYKAHDTYAKVRGYDEQNFGQSIMQVINPKAELPTAFTQCFVDPEMGADYLQFLRKKH